MNRNYDGAVTLFSPDGQLMQVGYAQEAVLKGSTIVGLCTKHCIVLGVEKKAVDPLQIERTVRKIRKLDDHLMVTFAGLTADARVLIDRAQSEAQSHRLNRERPATVEYITRYIANLKQLYTQSNGLRPFGVACLIAGYNDDGQPHLFQTEPSGIYYEWQTNSTGRMGHTMRAFLEKNGKEMVAAPNEMEAIKHVVRALHLTTSLNASFFEIAVLKYKEPMIMVSAETIGSLLKLIKQELAEELAQQKQRIAG